MQGGWESPGCRLVVGTVKNNGVGNGSRGSKEKAKRSTGQTTCFPRGEKKRQARRDYHCGVK